MAVQEVKVTIYTVTGKQLFFKVNPAYCRECDMTVKVVETALGELNEVNAKLEVKPWLNHLVFSIFKGGHHPPVLLVQRRMVSQGVVPTIEEVKKAVLRAWRRNQAQERKMRVNNSSMNRLKEW